MHSPGVEYWIGFSLVDGMGPSKMKRLLDYFETLSHAWQAHPDQLVDAGIDFRTAQAFGRLRSSLDLGQQLVGLNRIGAHAICWADPRYPRLLRHIANPPMVLYIRGDLAASDELAVAVVGTRQPSPYGRQVAQQLASELAGKGVTIVSGLARGIDAEAHRAALSAGGRTLAVLGSGVDVIYPREHAGLAREIAAHGAVLSDYPLGSKPDAVHFPARNRIVSGLALGTIVVEAGDTSGALITARFAGEQGRDIFAVPGSIFAKQSLGVHRLIQDGAKLVAKVEDVLDELNLGMVSHQLEMQSMFPSTDPTESALIHALSAEPLHVDDLARTAQLPVSIVSSTLTLMELKGLVRQAGALSYVLA